MRETERQRGRETEAQTETWIKDAMRLMFSALVPKNAARSAGAGNSGRRSDSPISIHRTLASAGVMPGPCRKSRNGVVAFRSSHRIIANE